MQIETPFHEGEIAIQKRAGEFEEAKRNGRVLADSIMRGALKFIAQQCMIAFGSVDEHQNVWASVQFGAPGFSVATDERTIEIDLLRAGINNSDPLWKNIAHDPRVGTLFIELATRRRLRINGTLRNSASEQIVLDIAECYPNCPKYIQRREISFAPIDRKNSVAMPYAQNGQALNQEQVAMIQAADMFFVASAHSERGVDVSHRGGRPGFIEVAGDRVLQIPDYSGNSMFNTLGNIFSNPMAGIVFTDFETNRMLQLTGRVEIQWDQVDAAEVTGGTQRFWTFKVDQWIETSIPGGVTWRFHDYSPHNPKGMKAIDSNDS